VDSFLLWCEDVIYAPFLPTQRAHFLELGVIRTFEFISALRRMSVIVKRLKSTSMEVYVKGAPEVMNEICVRDSCECFPVSLVRL
jgi:cation-transporting ATPase 13A3/4/5